MLAAAAAAARAAPLSTKVLHPSPPGQQLLDIGDLLLGTGLCRARSVKETAEAWPLLPTFAAAAACAAPLSTKVHTPPQAAAA